MKMIISRKIRNITLCLFVLLLGIGVGLLIKGSGSDLDRKLAPSENPIKVGVLLAMDGRGADLGQSIEKGIRLAQSQTPTILGRPIELIVFDNKGDAKLAATLAKELIKEHEVACIIGSNSSDIALAVAKVAERYGVPLLVPSATNPQITEGKEFVFRACFVDTFQGSAAAFYAVRDLASKKAAIIVEEDDLYSDGLAKTFEENYIRRGGKVLERLEYERDDKNFAPLLKKAMESGVDLLYMPAHCDDGIQILIQASDMGADFKILSSDAIQKSDLAKVASVALKDFYFTTFAYSPNMSQNLIRQKQKVFNALWQKSYSKETPNAFCAMGFDSYNLMLTAIKKSGTAERDEIRKSLEGIEFDGITGKLKMDKFHNAEKPVGIAKIVSGREKIIAIVEKK